ncbi:MAG: flagellar biosynthesis anti-sigma factor FlgM [Oscillospiraceae bacterium]|jgi:anti-sigma28 factor (negative regulator of flagellin synthesis)|nr:flagellar biosynthesis anti-sigma factor FlgM [Oscillospiraceae bacterium]
MDMNALKGLKGINTWQQTSPKRGTQSSVGEMYGLTKRSGRSDDINISEDGTFRAVLNKEIKSAAEKISKGVSEEKMTDIKKSIDAGTYYVSTGALVDSLLTRWG